jgi:2-(1,2-epoxy-1,2-dihydrophenyl)acetyl-CoA isomerase
MKRNLNAALRHTLSDILDMEAVAQMRSRQTEDHIEAASAFIEKREPKFKGR